MLNVSKGIKCKACDASLSVSNNLDDELCNDCMAAVFEYNRDLLAPEEEKKIELVFVPNYEEETLDYARQQ